MTRVYSLDTDAPGRLDRPYSGALDTTIDMPAAQRSDQPAEGYGPHVSVRASVANPLAGSELAAFVASVEAGTFTNIRIRSRAALATAVITAVAIDAPAAQARAATLSVTPPTAAATVTGPTLAGDVFNGPTEIVTTA